MRLSPEALEVKQALVGVVRAGERWKTRDEADKVILFGWAQGTVIRWSIDRLLLRNGTVSAKSEVGLAARFLRQETPDASRT